MSNVIIRRVSEKDVDQVLIMIRALSVLEGGDCLFTASRFLSSAFGKRKCFDMLIALDKDQYAGYITYHKGFDIQTASKGVYLIDLYVKSEFRKNGIGTELMSTVSRNIKRQDCEWISWHVRDSNATSIAFYNSVGAKKMDSIQYLLTI